MFVNPVPMLGRGHGIPGSQGFFDPQCYLKFVGERRRDCRTQGEREAVKPKRGRIARVRIRRGSYGNDGRNGERGDLGRQDNCGNLPKPTS